MRKPLISNCGSTKEADEDRRGLATAACVHHVTDYNSNPSRSRGLSAMLASMLLLAAVSVFISLICLCQRPYGGKMHLLAPGECSERPSTVAACALKPCAGDSWPFLLQVCSALVPAPPAPPLPPPHLPLAPPLAEGFRPQQKLTHIIRLLRLASLVFSSTPLNTWRVA